MMKMSPLSQLTCVIAGDSQKVTVVQGGYRSVMHRINAPTIVGLKEELFEHDVYFPVIYENSWKNEYQCVIRFFSQSEIDAMSAKVRQYEDIEFLSKTNVPVPCMDRASSFVKVTMEGKSLLDHSDIVHSEPSFRELKEYVDQFMAGNLEAHYAIKEVRIVGKFPNIGNCIFVDLPYLDEHHHHHMETYLNTYLPQVIFMAINAPSRAGASYDTCLYETCVHYNPQLLVGCMYNCDLENNETIDLTKYRGIMPCAMTNFKKYGAFVQNKYSLDLPPSLFITCTSHHGLGITKEINVDYGDHDMVRILQTLVSILKNGTVQDSQKTTLMKKSDILNLDTIRSTFEQETKTMEWPSVTNVITTLHSTWVKVCSQSERKVEMTEVAAGEVYIESINLSNVLDIPMEMAFLFGCHVKQAMIQAMRKKADIFIPVRMNNTMNTMIDTFHRSQWSTYQIRGKIMDKLMDKHVFGNDREELITCKEIEDIFIELREEMFLELKDRIASLLNEDFIKVSCRGKRLLEEEVQDVKNAKIPTTPEVFVV
jgi:hypothetical protein